MPSQEAQDALNALPLPSSLTENGISEEELLRRHPDLAAQKAQLESRFDKVGQQIKGTAIASGIVGAAIPIVFHKKFSKKFLLAVTSVVAGVAAAVTASIIVARSIANGFTKKLQTYRLHEVAAIDQEYAKAEVEQWAKGAPVVASPEATMPDPVQATQNIQPRAASFAAQAVKETAQASAPAVIQK